MSKLDDAFLKAYAKVRGGSTAPPKVDEPPQAPAELEEGEIWTDKDGEQYVRPDDGVMNVASFIARTANGRPRGTARPGGDGVADLEPPHSSDSPDWQSLSDDHRGGGSLVEQVQAVRSPHFQPIAVDL